MSQPIVVDSIVIFINSFLNDENSVLMVNDLKVISIRSKVSTKNDLNFAFSVIVM